MAISEVFFMLFKLACGVVLVWRLRILLSMIVPSAPIGMLQLSGEIFSVFHSLRFNRTEGLARQGTGQTLVTLILARQKGRWDISFRIFSFFSVSKEIENAYTAGITSCRLYSISNTFISIVWKSCHHVSIFSEGMVKIKNECHIRFYHHWNSLRGLRSY